MSKFWKVFFTIIGAIVCVPLLIVLISALFGFGAIAMCIPEIVGGVLIVLTIISIPGVIIGLIIGHCSKKN